MSGLAVESEKRETRQATPGSAHLPALIMNTDIAAQRALDRLEKDGFDALTDTEKTLATTWLIEAGVRNGGFARFFASDRGNVAFYAPAALRAIGANQLAGIAAEANAVFPPAGPPRDHNARQALVRALDESKLRTLESLDNRYCTGAEDTDLLLEVFLARQTAQAEKRG